MARLTQLLIALVVAMMATACSDNSKNHGAKPVAGDPALESALRTELARSGHTGKPSPELQPVEPADDPLVKLGQVLFFSRTLSGNFDVACATCHHPFLAGGDSLSLPVGVAATNPAVLGANRTINPDLDRDPRRDCLTGTSGTFLCGPNVPRNSQSTFNVALYQDRLFFDGRVEWLDKAEGLIRTAESGTSVEVMAEGSLLNAQARLPVPNANEMRGFGHLELTDPNHYRDMVVERLKGNEDGDSDRISNADAERWLALFRTAYASPAGAADSLITFPNIQRALGAFQRSTTFTDTPWANYVAGTGTVSDAAKRGALLFFRSTAEEGLGCAGCHSGNHFSDEQFHNTGMPQIGRGKRPDGQDRGREDVSRNPADAFAFRTPSLINATLTAPYGHAGTFGTLAALLDYHVNPDLEKAGNALAALPQFTGINKDTLYPLFTQYTEAALASDSFNAGARMLLRDLTPAELNDLTAFLATLTDPCAASAGCVLPWVPRRIDGELATGDDPDGHLLVLGEPSEADLDAGLPDTGSYPMAPVELDFPVTTPRSNFAELDGCSALANGAAANSGALAFSEAAAASGLDFLHAYSVQTWFAEGFSNSLEDAMMAGGISSAYINDDCWPDLVVAAGEPAGLLVFAGNADGNYSAPTALSSDLVGSRANGVGIADINGDYRREIFVGHLTGGATAFNILAMDNSGDYPLLATLPMYRNTWGMAFGDTDNDGWPDLFLTHWDQVGLPNIAPAMWKNVGGTAIRPNDLAARTGTMAGINQAWQFAPGFADFNADGHADLAIVSDFGTSMALQNDGSGGFLNLTNKLVVNDENGMGAAIGDYDNDGRLDWFVTSVYDPNGVAEVNWGVTGNRLYRNVSTPGGNILFEDRTGPAGVADGRWGWAACFADFNNDGWLDIFHENGFGQVPAGLIEEPGGTDLISVILFNTIRNLFITNTSEFISTPARLFISNGADAGGEVSFSERAADWGVGANSNGRGVICDDLDRDGDVDIALMQNSGPPRLYRNQVGSSAGHRFLAVRLVGAAPNTEALGARVTVSADTDNSGGISGSETQTRISAANSNFLAQNLPDLHFGLGSAAAVQNLTVFWPDGSSTVCSNPPLNRFVVLDQRAPVCP